MTQELTIQSSVLKLVELSLLNGNVDRKNVWPACCQNIEHCSTKLLYIHQPCCKKWETITNSHHSLLKISQRQNKKSKLKQ